jgi:hypothetical protein
MKQPNERTLSDPSRIVLPGKLEHWPIERLRPYERNPRTHSPEQITKIAASLLQYGWTNPARPRSDRCERKPPFGYDARREGRRPEKGGLETGKGGLETGKGGPETGKKGLETPPKRLRT